MKKCVSVLLGFFFLALSSVLLGGCGNDDDDGLFLFGGGTAPQVSTFSSGQIASTEDGVMVNGTRFNAGNADVTVNGNQGSVDDLRAGQMVTVQGTSGGGTGTANVIFYQNILTGPVSSIEGEVQGNLMTAGTLTVVVFGQNIIINPNTFIHPALVTNGTGTNGTGGPDGGLASLATGSVIEVSGMPLADGSILATAVITNPTTTLYNVHGIVSESTGTEGRTFTLLPAQNGTPLQVELAEGAELPGEFKDGMLVNVTIDPATVSDPASTTITAQSVTADVLLVPSDNSVVFLDGIVLQRNMETNTFKVGNSTVNAGNQTLPQDGSRTAVRGNFSNGVVNADQIQNSGSSNFTVGPVTSLDTGTNGQASRFTVNGTPVTTSTGTVGGTTFMLNGTPATAGDLRNGQTIVVRSGFDNTFSNQGTASTVFIIENLTGPISALSGSLGTGPTGTDGTQGYMASTATFTVLGQTIRANRTTVFEPSLPEGGDPLAGFSEGTVISVSGVSDGMGNIIATFIETRTDVTEYHVMGVASNVMGGTFELNNGTLRVIGGPGSGVGDVMEGDIVDVNIDPATYTLGDPEVVATDIDIVVLPFPSLFDNVNMNGIVTNLSGSNFKSGNAFGNINVNGSGLQPGAMDGVANGSAVNVRGNFSNGSVNATELRTL